MTKKVTNVEKSKKAKSEMRSLNSLTLKLMQNNLPHSDPRPPYQSYKR